MSEFFATIVLLDGYSLMSFASLTEPLRAANRVSEREVFGWRLVSARGGPVVSSGGAWSETLALGTAPRRPEDLVIVCGGQEDTGPVEATITTYLRTARSRGARIVSVSTGSFILAQAGLLDGRRCTTHWDYLAALGEAFPRLRVSSALYVVDGPICTCAGGVAAMDMMLRIVRDTGGAALATAVAENFVYGGVRGPSENQRLGLRDRLGGVAPALLAAVSLMETHVEVPLRLSEIALRTGQSTRQIERLALRHLGCSPVRYYADLRLQRARALLRHTSLPVGEVALATGFTSPAHFSRAYRTRFGCTPAKDRTPPAGIMFPPSNTSQI